MKRLFKALAIVLMLVMTVSLAQPLASEAAAKKPKLNCTKKTIYVGGSSVYKKYGKGSITLKVKNRPSKYSVTWTTDDPEIASIETLGKYRAIVTAELPGTAVITAEVVDKSKTPNTKYTLTCKVTIKANCAAVDIDETGIEPIEVGKSVKLSATMYDKSGHELHSGYDVTDTIKWMSSDPKVADVTTNGLVTGYSEGTATITCFTVQSTSGTYSKYGKATAKDTIKITVKEEDKAIKSVAQRSLNAFSIEFVKDFSKTVKLDNIKLTQGTANIALESIEFDNTGKVAVVKTKAELSASTAYTVSVTGTTAKTGLSAQFTSSACVPAKLSIYSAASGNLAIAAQATEIKYTLYDANGIDITPTDENSTAYLTYAGRITLSSSQTGVVYTYGRTVTIYEENKTATITATYEDKSKSIKLSASLTLTAVPEARTMVLAGVTVTKSSKSASELDWENTNTKLSASDYGKGYKLIARVKKADGTYIYSDVSTKITFSLVNNTPTAVFCDESGELSPFKTGADAIYVKYDGVVLGSVTVISGASRVPAKIKVLVDGVEATSVKISDSYNVTQPEIKVAVYDNYDELWDITGIPDVSFTSSTTNAPTVNYAEVDSDGLIAFSIFPYNSGTTAGKTYSYLVSFTSGTSKLTTGFTVLSYKPNEALTTNYRAVITGDTDMVVTSAFDTTNGKSIKISLIAFKGDVRYENITLKKKLEATSGDYYIVIKDRSGTEVTDFTITSGVVTVPVAKVSGNAITKMKTGNYTVYIYQKSSTSAADAVKNTAQFVLTDSQEGASFEQRSTTTTFTITNPLDVSVANNILAQCFDFWFAGSRATAAVTGGIAGTGSFYIQTVDVTGTVTVGGVPYQITVPLEINRIVSQSR